MCVKTKREKKGESEGGGGKCVKLVPWTEELSFLWPIGLHRFYEGPLYCVTPKHKSRLTVKGDHMASDATQQLN